MLADHLKLDGKVRLLETLLRHYLNYRHIRDGAQVRQNQFLKEEQILSVGKVRSFISGGITGEPEGMIKPVCSGREPAFSKEKRCDCPNCQAASC
jgi:hypothetical protein